MYKNKKTGSLYLKLSVVTNKSDAESGQQMVLYESIDDDSLLVITIGQFNSQFEEVTKKTTKVAIDYIDGNL